MDAANPLCRWLLAAVLAAPAAGAGCRHACDNIPIPTIRGQIPEPAAPIAPQPPGPLAPTAPSSPVVPGSSVPAGGVVQGFPVKSGPTDSAVKLAGAFSALPKAVNAAGLMKEGQPQIKVVALIGGTNLITDQEVLESVRQRLGEFRDLPGPARVAKERAMYAEELRRIIERELILEDMYAKLKKQGRMAMVDEIKEFAEKSADQSLRAIRKNSGMTSDEEFRSMLFAQGLTLPVIRRQMERQIMSDEYVRGAIKEKGRTPGFGDIRAYYEQHANEFKTEDRVKWLDIFISLHKHATPQDAYRHAEKVRQEAATGADFVALVKQYDNGLAIGTQGVGVGSKRGEIQPQDVERMVWSLKPGEVGPLIETPTGYHIVKIAERDYAGTRPFDVKVQHQIRDKLLRQYREDEYHKLIEELWRKGVVRIIEMP